MLQKISDGVHRIEADEHLAVSLGLEVLLHLIPEIVFANELHKRFQVVNGDFSYAISI